MESYKEAAAKAKKQGTAESVKPEWVDFKKTGQSVAGLLIDKQLVQGRTFPGEFTKYTMKTDDGIVQFKMGSATDKDTGVSMQIGEIYEVTFEGQENVGQNQDRNVFEVLHIPPIDLTAPNA